MTDIPNRRTLVPFDVAETISLKQAASTAGKSERQVRRWCVQHGIGRQIVPKGAWLVSRAALNMLLEGDRRALGAYLDGVRAEFEPVARHFRDVGLEHLLDLPAFANAQATSYSL
jgi:hypothetical protein